MQIDYFVLIVIVRDKNLFLIPISHISNLIFCPLIH